MLQSQVMIRPLTCPICEKLLSPEINGDHPLFPFCSARCKQADLYRWFSGHYAVVEDLTPEKLAESFLEDEPPLE